MSAVPPGWGRPDRVWARHVRRRDVVWGQGWHDRDVEEVVRLARAAEDDVALLLGEVDRLRGVLGAVAGLAALADPGTAGVDPGVLLGSVRRVAAAGRGGRAGQEEGA